METITDKQFLTTDPSLAAYLYVKNVRLQRLEPHNGRCIMVFDLPSEGMIEEFKTGRGQVSALLYYRAYKSIISRVNTMMEETRGLLR